MTTTERAGTGDGLVEMAWDPITRIVGSLGIYTKIDFANKRVAECFSTSSIFRYSIFMKGKDPATPTSSPAASAASAGTTTPPSVYNQNMAYGVRPPHLGEWIINLGESAECMFDHNIFQENLVGVDYCERMVKETNPGVLEQANAPRPRTPPTTATGPSATSCAPEPAGGRVLPRGAPGQPLHPGDVLPDGGPPRPPSTLPGRVGTVATVQLFTDYLTRLMRYVSS